MNIPEVSPFIDRSFEYQVYLKQADRWRISNEKTPEGEGRLLIGCDFSKQGGFFYFLLFRRFFSPVKVFLRLPRRVKRLPPGLGKLKRLSPAGSPWTGPFRPPLTTVIPKRTPG
jgi:hypothetical protein